MSQDSQDVHHVMLDTSLTCESIGAVLVALESY